jgi:HEPN domain-containing protein
MEKEELQKFWVESSDRDNLTMHHLFENEDYHWSLFMGHLVIEKLLKAYLVKSFGIQPPHIHNLLRLAEKQILN